MRDKLIEFNHFLKCNRIASPEKFFKPGFYISNKEKPIFSSSSLSSSKKSSSSWLKLSCRFSSDDKEEKINRELFDIGKKLLDKHKVWIVRLSVCGKGYNDSYAIDFNEHKKLSYNEFDEEFGIDDYWIVLFVFHDES